MLDRRPTAGSVDNSPPGQQPAGSSSLTDLYETARTHLRTDRP
ncbi:hypothetical protein [Streptomyces virginiae]|nr:hypothetical protein [Streptomyces virginiae]MCX4957296.1 hypothetical protein [Streptomyces virginiae]